MEYVPGGELYQLIKRSGKLSEDKAVFYLAEVFLIYKGNLCSRIYA